MQGANNGSLLIPINQNVTLGDINTSFTSIGHNSSTNQVYLLTKNKLIKCIFPVTINKEYIAGNSFSSSDFTDFTEPVSALVSLTGGTATFSCISTNDAINIGTKTLVNSGTTLSVETVHTEIATGVKIESSGSGNDFGISAQSLSYKLSFTYDNYMESGLTKSTWSKDIQHAAKLTITVPINDSNRISHLNIYRSVREGDYNLIKSIKTLEEGNVNTDSNPTDTIYVFIDKNNSIASYEAINGISETIYRPVVQFSTATLINNILAVTDAYVPEIDEHFPNYIFFSKPGQTAKFDYTLDYTLLPEKVNCIKGFAGRLYAFSDNKTYRIDPNSFVVEDTYEGAGCINNEAVVVTEYGMFFGSKNNIYHHDGANLKAIADPILRSTRFPDWSHSYQKAAKMSINNSHRIVLLFDSKRNAVLVFLMDIIYNVKVGKVWAYTLTKQRWDRWDSPLGASYMQDYSGLILISDGSKIYKYLDDDKDRRLFEWRSKLITMGADTQKKKVYSLKIEGNANGEVSNPADSTNDNIFIISDGRSTSLTKKDDSTYKLTGNRRTAKNIEIWLKNQAGYIESLGLIFRRKTIK